MKEKALAAEKCCRCAGQHTYQNVTSLKLTNQVCVQQIMKYALKQNGYPTTCSAQVVTTWQL